MNKFTVLVTLESPNEFMMIYTELDNNDDLSSVTGLTEEEIYYNFHQLIGAGYAYVDYDTIDRFIDYDEDNFRLPYRMEELNLGLCTIH